MERVYVRISGRLQEKKNLSSSKMPSPEKNETIKPIEETEVEVVEPKIEKIEAERESTLVEIYGGVR